jgi:hypothetical protein
MPSFVEAELQNRLWLWLEETQGCEVWPEVKLEDGRIDLFAETPDGERWGVEVKGATSTGINMTTIKQIHKYIESDSLDRVFFASYEVDEFLSLVEDTDHHYILDHGKCYEAAFAARQLINQDVDLDRILTAIEEENPALLEIELADDRKFEDWTSKLPDLGWPDHYYEEYEPSDSTIDQVVSALSDAVEWFPHIKQVGTILVPLNIEQTGMMGRIRINEELSEILTSQPDSDPIVLREADLNSRKQTISPNGSEVMLHHFLWREFGGLPEGALPNPESGNNSINIDLISFEDGKTATDVLQSGGKVIGIEAKTSSGLKETERLKSQLIKYTETRCLTHIYLAVPDSITGQAHDLLDDFPAPIETRCGVIGVDNTGDVRIVSEAESIPVENDGYGSSPEYPYYVGYGNSEITDVPDPNSIFLTRDDS